MGKLVDTEIQELLKMFGAIISCYSRIKRGRLCYSDHGVEAKKKDFGSLIKSIFSDDVSEYRDIFGFFFE